MEFQAFAKTLEKNILTKINFLIIEDRLLIFKHKLPPIGALDKNILTPSQSYKKN